MTDTTGPIAIRHPAPGATLAEHARAIGLLVAVVMLVGYFDLGRGDLINSLETGYALTVQEMARDGHWLIPTLNDRPRVLKPPLPFWIGGAVASVIEGDRASAELLRGLATGFGALTAVLIYLLGTRLFDRRAGLWAGLAWATMYLPVYEYSFARHDIFLAAFCVLAMLGLCKAWQRERWGWTVAGLGLVLAFQAKGPVSWVLLTLPTVCFVLLHRPVRWRYLATLGGLSLLAGLSLVPWLAFVELTAARDEWGAWYLSEGFGRAVQDFRPSNPPFYYLLIFAFVLPWASYLVAGLVIPWEKRFAARAQPLRFAWMWLVAGLVLMTLPRERETRYIVPLAAPAALLIGALVGFHVDLWRRRMYDPKAAAVWIGHAITLAVLAIALPIVLHVGGLIQMAPAIGSGAVLLAIALGVAWAFGRRHTRAAMVLTVVFGVAMNIGWQTAQNRAPLNNDPLRGKAAEVIAIVGDQRIISWPHRPPNVLIYYMGRSAPNLTEHYRAPDSVGDTRDVLRHWLAAEAPAELFIITPGADADALRAAAAAADYAARPALDLTTRKPREADEYNALLFLYRLTRTPDAG